MAMRPPSALAMVRRTVFTGTGTMAIGTTDIIQATAMLLALATEVTVVA